jgi:hypothetical protein
VRYLPFTRIRLRIDVAGTIGTQAWDELRHFDEICGGRFGFEEGASGECVHSFDAPHEPGEWIGAAILVDEYLMAEYAVAHYLEQSRVLDAFIDGSEA